MKAHYQNYKSEQLNDLEEEERRKSEELRQKAFEQVEEQEDEIKRLNEVSYGCIYPQREIMGLSGPTSDV